ncbi:hypothetical protein QCA50_003837 [Cerrena zonata]|uniref:Uncharacterized protein n=1 Tax=Cerrena zonata TaxID=2478898 RepID=A0AAW0GFF3_9APHY
MAPDDECRSARDEAALLSRRLLVLYRQRDLPTEYSDKGIAPDTEALEDSQRSPAGLARSTLLRRFESHV